MIRDNRARARNTEGPCRVLRLRRIRETPYAALQRRPGELRRQILPGHDAWLQIPRAVLLRVIEADSGDDAGALERCQLHFVVERRTVQRILLLELQGRAASERSCRRFPRTWERRKPQIHVERLDEHVDAEVVASPLPDPLRKLDATRDRIAVEEEEVVAEIELDGVLAHR